MPLEIVDEYRESAYAKAQTGLLFNLPADDGDREQLPEGVSLCMIVKNEERFLGECLASVRDVVDEIIVCDTGSTDRTIEIARSFGATVIEREWRNDFAWAKNEALAYATRRWTLVLDADEELASESAALIRSLAKTPAGITAVYVQIENLIEDFSGDSTMTHYLPRVFPTTPRVRYRNPIHENLCVDGGAIELPIVFSSIRILHKGYTKAVLEGRKKDERNRPMLEKAVREQSDDQFSWFNFGVAAIAANDADTGIDALEKMFAVADQPRAFWAIAYQQLASAWGDLKGDHAKALEILARGLEHAPNHPNLLFAQGYFQSVQGRYEAARASYRAAIESRFEAAKHFMVDDEIPGWKAPFNLASTYAKEGDHAEAAIWFAKAQAYKPESAMLRTVTANAFERAGRIFDAEKLFREAGERDGVSGRYALANFLLRRRRFTEAFEIVERSGELDDRQFAQMLLSAAVVTRDEALGDPESYLTRALRHYPGYGLALTMLDDLYAERGEAQKRAAIRVAELDAEPVTAADWGRRSHRLLEEGRNADARAAAETGLLQRPHDGILRYNAALAAARTGDDEAARAHVDRIGDGDAHKTSALALRAQIAQRAGDYDSAIAAIEAGAALPQGNDVALREAAVGLATDLLRNGRLAEAGRLAERVLS